MLIPQSDVIGGAEGLLGVPQCLPQRWLEAEGDMPNFGFHISVSAGVPVVPAAGGIDEKLEALERLPSKEKTESVRRDHREANLDC